MDFWAILCFSLKFSPYFSAMWTFFVYCTVSWTFLLVFSHWQRSFCHYNHESEFCPKPRHLGHFVGGGMGLGGLLTVGGSWQSGDGGVEQNRVSPDFRSPKVGISEMAGCYPLFFFGIFIDLDFIAVHKYAKKKLAKIQPFWPHTTWKIKLWAMKRNNINKLENF